MVRLMELNAVLAASVLVFALAGCGDDDDDGVGDDGVPTVDAAAPAADAAPNGIDAGAGPPVASFTMDPTCTDPAQTNPSEPVDFVSTSTDPEGQALTCTWTFPSGTPSAATECEVTGVTFPGVAPYDVTLTVEDPDGNTDTASMPIGPCQ